MKAVFISETKSYFLTQGKTYEVMETYPEQTIYKIINDDGNLGRYSKSMFMTLEEWRDRQLNEILKEE